MSQLFTWAVTIIVIRILSPADYGLIALATLFTSFLMLINELGLGAALVQQKDLDDSTVGRIAGITLTANLIFFLVLQLSAPAIAWFFDEPRLTEIVRVLALLFVISAFEVVPVALLERELDFKRKATVALVANVAAATLTLVLAIAGFGVWALVLGNVALAVIKTLGFNLAIGRFYRPRFSFAGMRHVLRFGGFVMLERTLWYFYTRADVFVIAKLLGNEALGFYYVANNLASMIYEKTGGILYEVSFPAFSRIQHDSVKLADYFLKAVRLVSVVAFPIFFGLAAVAPEVVSVLLGDKWIPATPVLVAVSLIMPARMLANLLPPILQGVGQPGLSVSNLALALVVMPAAFVVGAQFGIEGVALSWLIVFPVVLALMFLRSRRYVHTSSATVLTGIVPPLTWAALMYALVTAARMIVPASLDGIALLALLVVAGGLTYIGLTWFLSRSRADELYRLVAGKG